MIDDFRRQLATKVAMVSPASLALVARSVAVACPTACDSCRNVSSARAGGAHVYRSRHTTVIRMPGASSHTQGLAASVSIFPSAALFLRNSQRPVLMDSIRKVDVLS